ncbi:MAG: CRTAC1 family protein [Proteobacteria bacterium]|nr:CRTAC1 family protein [Pseudomonadota bacterium]MCP4915827.1 CRTAC1 family protein [Pseudomonadota bacterium]
MILALPACKTSSVEPPTCASPVSGFERFEESAEARGADVQRPVERGGSACSYVRGGLVASDLDGDGDGDVDLVLHETDGALTLLENDGGSFTQSTVTAPATREVYATAAVDLDGDGLPELAVVGASLVLVATNLGDNTFGDWEVVLDEPDFPRTCHLSMGWGDGDGDLDLGLPGSDRIEDTDPLSTEWNSWVAAPDRILLNEDGAWRELGEYAPELTSLSLFNLWTDFDGDGDLDWFTGADRIEFGYFYGPSQLYENRGLEDGDPVLVDIAPQVGLDTWASAMGMTVADMNHDGALDYCVSDLSDSLRCFVWGGVGGYVESGAALGLSVDLWDYSYTSEDWRQSYEPATHTWVSWAFALDDLDNDGFDDMAAAAGPFPMGGNPLDSTQSHFQPDAIWSGGPDGFTDRSESTGFGEASSDYAYAMVSADLDGDGFRELVVGYHTQPLAIWDNPCGDGGWLEVQAVGVDANVQALGARIEVESGGRTQVREVQGLVLNSQAPTAQHFGLGDAAVRNVRVVFPDGAVVETGPVAASQKLVLEHPDR